MVERIIDDRANYYRLSIIEFKSLCEHCIYQDEIEFFPDGKAYWFSGNPFHIIDFENSLTRVGLFIKDVEEFINQD